MAQRQPLATQIPLTQGKFILPKRSANPRAVARQRQQRGARRIMKITVDDAPLGNSAAFVRQKDLDERALATAGRAVVGQVEFQRADPDISYESGHCRDRSANCPELADCFVHGSSVTAYFDNELPWHGVPAIGYPAGEQPNANRAKTQAGHRVKVQFPAVLRQEPSRRPS